MTFSVTSALASSISSRTSSETRSVISWTVCARSWVGLSVAKAPKDHGGEDAAGERRADDELGTLGERRRLLPGSGRAGGVPGRAWPSSAERRAGADRARRDDRVGCSARAASARPARDRAGAAGGRLGAGGSSAQLDGLALDDGSARGGSSLVGRRPGSAAGVGARREPRPRSSSRARPGSGRSSVAGAASQAPRRRARAARASSLSRRLPNFIRAGLPRRCAAKSSPAARVVAIEAIAPSPASRPDQTRRLTMSFVGHRVHPLRRAGRMRAARRPRRGRRRSSRR